MKKKSREKHIRSIVKSITFRTISSIITGIIAWLFTKDFSIAFYFICIDVVIKLLIYYFHERVWGNIKWGLNN